MGSATAVGGAGFTRSVMELADLPGHPAPAVAREHKATVQTWIARELAERDISDAAGKAGQLQLILEGCFVLLLIHGDETYIGEAAATARLVIVQEGRPTAA